MADPLTIVGAVASIAQLVDVSAKVVTRLHEYSKKTGELPSAFKHINDRLPVLHDVLGRMKATLQNGLITSQEAAAIEPCVQGCQQQVNKLDDILSKITTGTNDSTAQKMAKGLRSLLKESDVREIDLEIERHVSTLTFYCAWSSSKLDTRNGQADLLVPLLSISD